ncbi:MAG: hypothetical protein HOI70_00070 [Opitutae bacterium]|nr:hypothetical protein [Opitutae bacterium]
MNEGIEGDSVRSNWIEALDRCLEKLPSPKRSLFYKPKNMNCTRKAVCEMKV